VDLVAYRVLEEGLTNALKHGTGTAQLSIDYGPTSLRLRVANGTAAR
jgi:signal transduction histidine kinase